MLSIPLVIKISLEYIGCIFISSISFVDKLFFDNISFGIFNFPISCVRPAKPISYKEILLEKPSLLAKAIEYMLTFMP